jgi:hypothetical protein
MERPVDAREKPREAAEMVVGGVLEPRQHVLDSMTIGARGIWSPARLRPPIEVSPV